MKEASLALSAAQTLLTSLQSPEIRGLFSIWGYKSELEDLERTVKTINSVLLSADSNQMLTPQERVFIDNFKDVVYEAEDLIDEFVTTVALQQQRQSHGKVREFFSSMNKLGFGYKMFRKVKKIRKMLDRVADDALKFSFKIDDLPIRKRIEETREDVNVSSIVGRDDDLQNMVHVLLDPIYSHDDVCVVSIVGIGGLGKTTLAQLIYNHPRIVQEFPLRLWACVSDQEQEELEVKPILANILNSTPEMHIDELSLDQLLKKVHKKLDANKYLLVLDDVWTENHNDWLNLKEFLLTSSQRGNKIVVTTRSKRTAVTVESSHIYMLQGLSDESSWSLFETIAGYEQANSPDLVEIGHEIVKKCANVPLAIKMVGSLLYGQERNVWLSLQNTRLSDLQGYNNIMAILELSYHHLSPPLKSCFTYCALFPKNFNFDKEKLLGHWMAQDYVKPLDKYDKIEDAAEEYFQILSHRSFFQDIFVKDQTVKFKIHDLMHEMALQVAGNEISTANSTTSTIGKRIRHLYDNSPDSRTQDFMVESKIRTYLTGYGYGFSQFPVSTLIAKWRSLRTLDLSHLGLRSLPDTIGRLLHLRYLDLCSNKDLKLLPKSLTKLINLQFLDLRGCIRLKELPGKLSKLLNLTTLYVPETLESMPLGMEKMTRLTRLNYFIVCEQRKSCLNLEELRALRNLRGSLGIRVCGNYCGKGKYISNTQFLNTINIEWIYNEVEEARLGNDEELLEDLQPHTNLQQLYIWGYRGVRIPRWAKEDSLTTSLPNLVKIHLKGCDGLEELPWLGRLQHLKTLVLEYLQNVEYLENRRSIGSHSDNEAEASNSSTPLDSSTILFFPSLEILELIHMPKFKGLWMGEDEIVSPPAYLLRSLHSLKLSSLGKVVTLPKVMRYLSALQTLEIEDVPLKEIPEWIECLSSLQSLKIKNCKSLESLPIEMKNLVSLKEFDLIECSDELKCRCEKPDGEYCPILNHIPTLTIL